MLGGIEPKVRDYRQSSRQTFAATSSFLHQGAAGIYLFNYDCHRLKASSSKFGGVLQDYTPEEQDFLEHALDPVMLRDHDKHYLISHDSGRRLAEDGGKRPLMCRLPVGKPKTFTMHVGDDLKWAIEEHRMLASKLVVTLKDCAPKTNELVLVINDKLHGPEAFRFATLRPSDIVEVTVVEPPLQQGANTIQVGLKAGSEAQGIIRSIDFYIDYASRQVDLKEQKPAGEAETPGDLPCFR